MKISLQDAIAAKKSCEKFLSKNFSAKTSFRLVKLKKELEILNQSFLEAKDKCLEKYGEKDENGKLVINTDNNGLSFSPIPAKNQGIFTKELIEILEEEIEVSDTFFNIEDFGEELVSGEDLLGLLPFIKD